MIWHFFTIYSVRFPEGQCGCRYGCRCRMFRWLPGITGRLNGTKYAGIKTDTVVLLV